MTKQMAWDKAVISFYKGKTLLLRRIFTYRKPPARLALGEGDRLDVTFNLHVPPVTKTRRIQL